MGRIRAVGRQTKAANTGFLTAHAQQSPEHWALTKHTNKTNIHSHEQLHAYSQQGREGSCKMTCAPSPNNIKLLVKSNITTSFWVTVSQRPSLFLVHRVFVIQWSVTTLWADHLGSPGRSFLTRWKVCPCRFSLIQRGQMRSDFSGTDSTRLQQEAELWKRINKCSKQLYAAEFVNMEYYWILHQVT